MLLTLPKKIPLVKDSTETLVFINRHSKRLQREGKIGTKGIKYSLESRKKMSEWQIGRKMSPESKTKMSEKAKGRKWYKCPETKKQIFYRDAP